MPGQILVIDDEEKYAQMLRDLLDDHNFIAEYCIDPQIALERIQKEQFDLVVTDYKMPVIDGAEFLVRARKTNPDLPVIIVSGLMNMPELIKVANIGVTLVLEKPFDTADFMAQVRKFVEPRAEDEGMGPILEEDEDEPEVESRSPFAVEVQDLVAVSPQTRRLVELIHAEAGKRNLALLEARTDSDWALLGAEIARWNQFPEPRKNLHIPFSELADEDFRDEALEDIEAAEGRQWIAIEAGDRPNNRMKDEIISTLLVLDEAGLTGDGFLYLFQVPPGMKLQLARAEVLAPLHGRILEGIHLLRFRDRVEDTAAYLQKLVVDAVGQPNPWSEDAIHFALGYPWPGEYKEIRGVSQKLVSQLGSEEVDLDLLKLTLSASPQSRDHLPTDFGLQPFLLRRQRDYIDQMGHNLGDWRATLSRLGIDEKVFSEANSLDDLPLLYPDLVSGKK